MSPKTRTTIEEWARQAIGHADYEQLSDGSWFARVPGCPGAIATGVSREVVRDELLSVLEDWAYLGIQLGDDIPPFGGVSLNTNEGRRYATS